MEWIDLSHKKPEKGKWVLVFDGQFMDVAQLDEENIFYDINVYRVPNITHWAFLPNQPERSKREDCPKLMRYTTPAKQFAVCMGEYKHKDRCGALNTVETQ